MLAFIIAWAGILIGELDAIARVVSMFFITTYGFLNLTAAIESWVSPDFRPEFRVPKLVAIIGSIACFVVMIQLDFVAMLGASVILGGLYVYLKYHPERGVVRTGVPRELPVLGPAGTRERAAAMYGLEPGEDMATEYSFRAWEAGTPVRVGPLTLEPFRVNHPVEAYGVRVTGPS